MKAKSWAPALSFHLLACVATASAAADQLHPDKAPIDRAAEVGSEPIRDHQGRVHYIVDLNEWATVHDARSAQLLTDFTDRHEPDAVRLVGEFAQRLAMKPTGMISNVGLGFSAFLTEAQAEMLRSDRRVRLLTEDRHIDLGAVWSDLPLAQEILPWGIQAVGGGGFSSGTYPIYVLDGGVGHHGDLNVVERLSGTSGHSPIGCGFNRNHATHVAGIIGARRNLHGTIGVRAGAPIVSVSVGHGGTPTSGCSDGTPLSGVRDGMETIRNRIHGRGLVGIVNISMNNGAFRQTGTLGIALRGLATPAPHKAYPGAFVVQSAGNNFVDACTVSYDDTSASDGIMVVGAIDDNGQPVRPLNGLPRFRNQPLAADESGSNFGSCVEIWAPGARVYSTWGQPTNAYRYLYGTSMAAPHVAGVALALTEDQGLSSPAAIEAAVRAHMVTLLGSDARIPNLTGTSVYAQPTMEFAEGGVPIGHFERFDDRPISLRYDSVGAVNCHLRAFINSSAWYQAPNMPAEYIWPESYLNPGQYRWELECRTAANASGVVDATARVWPSVRHATWQINTTSTGGTWADFTGVSHPNSINVSWAAGQPFLQRYLSQGADYCEVTSWGVNDFGSNEVLLWSSGIFPTAYDFGTFHLPDPRTAPPPLGPYAKYRWDLACHNWAGDSKSSTVYGTMTQ